MWCTAHQLPIAIGSSGLDLHLVGRGMPAFVDPCLNTYFHCIPHLHQYTSANISSDGFVPWAWITALMSDISECRDCSLNWRAIFFCCVRVFSEHRLETVAQRQAVHCLKTAQFMPSVCMRHRDAETEVTHSVFAFNWWSSLFQF